METVHEEWRAVKGFEGRYEVSSFGQVRSMPRFILMKNGQRRFIAGVVRLQNTKSDGYLLVSLRREGKSVGHNVHSLIAEAFLGPKPKGMQVNHIDGVKKNNRASNLEYVTHSENQKHAYRLGLQPRKLPGGITRSAYTEDQIRIAHSLVLQGMTYRQAANESGVSGDAIREVCRGRSWKHLSLPTFIR